MDYGALGSGLGGLTSIAGGLFSGITGSEDSKKIRESQKAIAGLEMQQDYVRRTAMEFTSRRQGLQNIRQTQLAQAMGLATATAQGGQFGSLLGGVSGAIAGASNTNALNNSQNLMFGENMFKLQDQISGQKMNLADEQSNLASDQAFGNLLGGIGGSMGNIFKMGPSLRGMFGG